MNIPLLTIILSSISSVLYAVSNEHIRIFLNKIFNYLKIFKTNKIYLNSNELIYYKFEKYLLDKFKNLIYNTKINNSLEEHFNENSFHFIYDHYKNKTIYISLITKQQEKSNDLFILVIESYELSRKDLVNYINKNQIQFDCIYIINPHLEDKNGNLSVNLIESKEKINKRRHNIFLSEKVEKTFFDKIDKFIKSKSTYSYKGHEKYNIKNHYESCGLRWKITFCLRGKPGVGKTSMIDVIAGEYNLDIYKIPMVVDFYESNRFYSKIFSKILEVLPIDKPYIISIEDINMEWIKRNEKTLIEFLDGTNKYYGRILILTTNEIDKKSWELNPNLNKFFRNGRIDNIIDVEYCDSYQVKNMLQFFDITLNINKKNYLIK